MKHLPFLGVLSAVLLFWWSAGLYPGGTQLDPTTVGYSWTENTISALFQPYAVNGEENPARWYATFAVFLFCLSIAAVFHAIATAAQQWSRRFYAGAVSRHGQIIRIAGVAMAVFTFLVTTPLHHIKVTIALVFFLVTAVTLLNWLWQARAHGLFLLGLLALALPVVNAILFYGQMGYEWLPPIQKAGKLVAGIWLFAIYYGFRQYKID
ncbi:MAG: hypothetical protein LAT77_05435 [Aliidiomarina sp.]|uniref:hypothetical protein n=1 Tax=Aliidiomarina sp. TaxID=1872439 RepID=UPI0025B98874|nr:hypothetical protein [Aliidiomarina sp.]MCH8501339.1 hypothetical protein [Aliidiomarina sp.]